MNLLVLISIAANTILFVGIAILWRRITGPKRDDPRLSKGLQILQNKIAILEDLSDRTDTQVKQLSALLEQKSRELQERMFEADQHIQKVRHSMDRSLEVAQIFEDRIPHQEIIERQNTKKYILAAQLAHEGKSLEEIANTVNLPNGELELIVKMNRDSLMFSEADLPAWAKGTEKSEVANSTPKASVNSERPKTLESLGSAFRQALTEVTPDSSSLASRFSESKIFQKVARVLDEENVRPKVIATEVKPAAFKKINLNDALG